MNSIGNWIKNQDICKNFPQSDDEGFFLLIFSDATKSFTFASFEVETKKRLNQYEKVSDDR